MNETSISWTHGYQGRRGRTWNPTDGCDVCSAGCANCYAMRMAGRFSKPGKPYHGLVTIAKNKRAVWNGEGRFAIERLTLPLRWRAKSLVFVDSMSDLYYDAFSFEQIAAVYGIMAISKHHVFQVLTKRAKRRRDWHAWVVEAAHHAKQSVIGFCVGKALDLLREAGFDRELDRVLAWYRAYGIGIGTWPLRNVWEGASVENQDAADERIPDLLETPAAVRFLSCEPLLGHVTIARWLRKNSQAPDTWKPPLDWIIAGCESGPGARPCDVAWLRSLRDQCEAASVAFYLKQAKSTLEETHQTNANGKHSHLRAGAKFAVHGGKGSRKKPGSIFEPPYLDGRQHTEFPRAA